MPLLESKKEKTEEGLNCYEYPVSVNEKKDFVKWF